MRPFQHLAIKVADVHLYGLNTPWAGFVRGKGSQGIRPNCIAFIYLHAWREEDCLSFWGGGERAAHSRHRRGGEDAPAPNRIANFFAWLYFHSWMEFDCRSFCPPPPSRPPSLPPSRCYGGLKQAPISPRISVYFLLKNVDLKRVFHLSTPTSPVVSVYLISWPLTQNEKKLSLLYPQTKKIMLQEMKNFHRNNVSIVSLLANSRDLNSSM